MSKYLEPESEHNLTLASLGNIDSLCKGALVPKDFVKLGIQESSWKKGDDSGLVGKEASELRVNPCGFLAVNFPKGKFQSQNAE